MSQSFEFELVYVDPELLKLITGDVDKTSDGFRWEPVSKQDPGYDEDYCTHRLVRDDS